MADNVYYCNLLVPGTNISDWLLGSGGGGIDRVNARSEWTHYNQVNYIFLESRKASSDTKIQIKKTILQGDRQRHTSLRKNEIIENIPQIFIGDMQFLYVRKFLSYLSYAKSEWAKITAKRGTIVWTTSAPWGVDELSVGTSTIAEVGGAKAEHLTDPEGLDLKWINGLGFKRKEVTISHYKISRDMNIYTLDSLALDGASS